MKNKTHYIGPHRRLFQWATTLLLLLLPWFEVDGKSLLRIDIPGLNLYLFGQVLRIQELYLVLLATLIFVLAFLLVTVVLGRVWCGWLCPQTTLSDLAEWVARRLGLTVKHNSLHGSIWRKVLVQGVYLFLAFLVAANLLWYFMPPSHFFARLFTFDLHYAAWITLVVTWLLIYLDLTLVRRLMCRELCPYGRIQTALVDKATLSLHLPATELGRCIECDSCIRACPMEIDIRHGYQIECTNCGSCLDACRKVMAKRNEPGLICYTFGLHGEGVRELLNPRVILPAVVMLALLITLCIALADRPGATLKIAVSHTTASRQLADGQTGTFFNGWVNNRSQEAAVYTIKARQKESGAPLPLKGQVRTNLAAGANRRLDFVLVTPTDKSLTIEFVLTGEEGLELSRAEAYIGKTKKK
ncbi:MAG: 4Fe-4S binding protein [Desulfobulbaceae bacterium]|nr:4Fe-4S binding protein [Desulfobulbaceae bacterium]